MIDQSILRDLRKTASSLNIVLHETVEAIEKANKEEKEVNEKVCNWQTIMVNVDNENLSDKEFRDFVLTIKEHHSQKKGKK